MLHYCWYFRCRPRYCFRHYLSSHRSSWTCSLQTHREMGCVAAHFDRLTLSVAMNGAQGCSRREGRLRKYLYLCQMQEFSCPDQSYHP